MSIYYGYSCQTLHFIIWTLLKNHLTYLYFTGFCYTEVIFLCVIQCSTESATQELARGCLDQDLLEVWNACSRINPEALNNVADGYYR